jgi:hypothetical protein
MTALAPTKFKLLKDIKSNRMVDKKAFKVYGTKDEVVELIAEHGEIYIVQGKKERFSVKKEFLKEI